LKFFTGANGLANPRDFQTPTGTKKNTCCLRHLNSFFLLLSLVRRSWMWIYSRS